MSDLTCPRCGHDANVHSGSYGCLEVVLTRAALTDEDCGCPLTYSQLVGR